MQEIMEVLSNIFLLAGVITTGLGLLIFASNLGSFDMLSYGTKLVFNLACSEQKRKEFHNRYPDYYAYYTEKRKEKVKYSYLLKIGVIFMLFSVLFTILFYIV